MNFFLDENFPVSATAYLESQSHNVFDIRNTSLEGVPDDRIFNLCQTRKAVFLTTDRGFFHTIPFSVSNHFGIIVIALRQPNRKRIMDRLKWFLEKSGMNDFLNKVVLLRDNTYSIRSIHRDI